MKEIKNLLVGMIVGGGLIVGLHLLQAQTAVVGSFNGNIALVPDSVVQLTADAQGLALVPPDQMPRSGTFWVIMPGYGGGVTALPYPCMTPALAGLPVYGITDNAFLVDATGGQVMAGMQRAGRLTANMTVESALEAQASAVVSLINMVQGAQSRQMSRAMGMDIPGFGDTGGGGDGANGFYSDSFTPRVYTTNDLWLEILGTTNTGTRLTAYLTIHPPWNVTNGVWGLYFKTNLAIPHNWKWLLRNAPGQTNLVVTNLPPTLGFFMLGDPTAIRPGFTNNSLGPNDDDCYSISGFDSDHLITNLLATIGFPINFFGTSYTNLYVNNNGNVTFNNFLSAYTPEPLIFLVNDNFARNIAPTNIIAPFWADVDTRGTNSGVVTYGTNTVDGRAAFGVNWIDVGYYWEEDDKTEYFQLILIDRSDRTNGDFDLELNYSQIQWEAGDVSGGCDGLWTGYDHCDYYDGDTYSARVGFASASGSTFELNGSAVPGAFLDTNTVTGLIYTNFNSTVPGRYVFQFHNGVSLATP